MNKAKVFFITQGTCKTVADFDQALAEVTKAIKSSEIKRGSNGKQREKKKKKQQAGLGIKNDIDVE